MSIMARGCMSLMAEMVAMVLLTSQSRKNGNMGSAVNLGGNSRTSGGLSSLEAVTPNKVAVEGKVAGQESTKRNIKKDMANRISGHHGINTSRGSKLEILIDEGEEGQVGDKRQFMPRAMANVGRILSEISNNLDDKTSEKNNNPKGVNSSLTIGTEGSKKGRKTFNKPFKEDTKNI
ncbi:hypothetical protein ACOSQ4_032892 [Xanthoceras sorbifolium]